MGLIHVLGAAQRDRGDGSSGKAQLAKEHIQSLLLVLSVVCVPGSCLSITLSTQMLTPSASFPLPVSGTAPSLAWHIHGFVSGAQLALEQAEELGGCLGIDAVIPCSRSEIQKQLSLGVSIPGPWLEVPQIPGNGLAQSEAEGGFSDPRWDKEEAEDEQCFLPGYRLWG